MSQVRNKKTSWPFKWSNSTKHIRDKMDFWVVNVKDESKVITLKKLDYDALMAILPSDFPKFGTPIYQGREIKRMGS
jgi:hypothetical protein